jgi:hypothetical protein
MESIGKAIGVISKNVDEKIAECKAEIAELEGDRTIISAIINFAKESGEALFSSVSSSDNGKKSSEYKAKKLEDLNTKLAGLLKEKKAQGKDGESSDSPDGLSEDELKGDDNPLADYVNKLKDDGTPYEVVRKGTMIGIKTTSRGGDPNSMSNVMRGAMKTVSGMLWGSSEESLNNKNTGDNLDQNMKLEIEDIILDMKEAGRDWYDGDQVLNATRNETKMDRDDKNDNSELLGVTQSEIFEMQIENAKEIADKDKTALMPINIGGNHWVGGAMTKEGDEFKFIHNDPLGKEIDSELSKVLKSQDVDVIDLQHNQQKDAYNCGPYTADNLSKFAEAIENKGKLDLSSKEFKQELKGKLRGDGDQIREEQQGRGGFASPKTPPINSTSKGSEGRG